MNWFEVVFMYSFMIASSPPALLFFNYRNKITKQLRNLRTNNPKEYWKILNSGRHKKQPNISIENLLQFFKNLNGA
jgi:hypothetical protein